MLLTLGFLYMYMYIIIIVIIFYIFTSVISIQYFIHYSLSIFIVYIKKYTNYNILFSNLFLCLSGLPPVGLFFIKFNLLNYIINQSHIATIFVVYFVFLLNMFFYLQLFNFKNNKYSTSSIVTSTIFKYIYSYSCNPLYNSNYKTYYGIFFIVFLFFIFYFFAWYITDFFLITHSFSL